MIEDADTPSPMFKLDQAFLEDFNDLIDDSLGSFEIMPGWAYLVWEIGEAVRQHRTEELARSAQLVQVREKLGTLRIRLSGYTFDLLELVETLEDRSAALCMYCGQGGQLELGIEALTACPVCGALRLDPTPEAATQLRQRMDDQIIGFLHHRAGLATSRNNVDD